MAVHHSMARNVCIGAFLLLAGLLCIQATPDGKVKAAKDKLAHALENDEDAWTQYVLEYGGDSVMNLIAGPLTDKLPKQDRENTFEACFKAALREMDKLNKEIEATGYEDVAFGINNHAHLCPDDFAALRTTGVLRGSRQADFRAEFETRRKKSRRAGPAQSSNAAGATACSSGTGNVTNYVVPNSSLTIPPVDGEPGNYWWVGHGVTPIKDQGQCGSCVAFATTAVTEWVLYQRHLAADSNWRPSSNSDIYLSEDDLMECDPTMNGCSGAWLYTYFSSASCRGQGFADKHPYDLQDSNVCEPDNARAFSSPDPKITDPVLAGLRWAQISRTSNSLEAAVGHAPAQIGIWISNKFQYYNTGVLPCSFSNRNGYSNHAVTVVGYGIMGTSGTKFFLIKNSWGTKYGDQGYIKLQRGCSTVDTKGRETNYGPCMMFKDPPIVPVL